MAYSSTNDAEFLTAVKSDLIFLAEEWDHEISEQSLRRSSNVLRNLLVDGALGRAWRLTGQAKEPSIEAVDLARELEGLRYEKIVFAAAGGGSSGGIAIAGGFVYSEAMSESQIKERYERNPEGPPTRRFTLSQFMGSPAIVVQGERTSRRDVVKYVANKLGGTHFDDRRTKRVDQLLDHALGQIQLADKRAPYFELLSIGQATASAEDVLRLRDLIT